MLFLKVIKISVHISTVKHVTEPKLFCIFNNYRCLWQVEFEMKNRFVCTLWFSVHMKSVVEPGFALNSHLTTKYWYLKHASNFEYVENIQSSNNVKFKFKLLVFRTLLYRFLWPTSSSVILNACLCLCVIVFLLIQLMAAI